MISPARGLLVYVPSIYIVAYLLAVNYKNLEFKPLVNVLISILVLHTIVMSSQRIWWAGVSYGPRLYTDVVPIFVLLAVIAISAKYRRHGSFWQFDEGKVSWRSIKIVGVIICIVETASLRR